MQKKPMKSQKKIRNLAIILLVTLAVIIVISPSQITNSPMQTGLAAQIF